MGKLMISFLGLNIYFDDFPGLVPPGFGTTPHRMVLINASPEMIKKIPSIFAPPPPDPPPPPPPHIAKIQIPLVEFGSVIGALPITEQQGSFVATLKGVRLSIPNATGPYLNLAGCIPHLASTLTNPLLLGPPNALVYNSNHTEAACYVDFSSGTLTAWTLPIEVKPRSEWPGITQLVMETDGHPQLLIQPFPNGGTFGNSEPTVITLLPDPAEGYSWLNVMNFPFGQGAEMWDTPYDYLINYLAAETYPPREDILIPTEIYCPPTLIRYDIPTNIKDPLTPGCSNSGYP